MPHTTIWLDKDTYNLVKEICKQEGCSEGLLIREALKVYLEGKYVRKEGIGDSDKTQDRESRITFRIE